MTMLSLCYPKKWSKKIY